MNDFPRPLDGAFSDRSTLVLHDLQSASFREKDATRYEYVREYLVYDADTNGDGVLTARERAARAELADEEEVRHLRETIIYTGNSNGYLFTYPIRTWIEANKDRSPVYAPLDEIAVNQLQLIEAYPGISSRAGITNVKTGFRFQNLSNFGTDYDGDPAVLMDYRLPGSVFWTGNNSSNLISGLDDAFLKVFENRYDFNGVPVSYAGGDRIQFSELELGEEPGDPVIITAPLRLDQEPLSPTYGIYGLGGHGLEGGEEIYLYETGIAGLDGGRFYVNLNSDVEDFDANTQVELFVDEGLTIPFTLEAIPDGTFGEVVPLGGTPIPGITITPAIDAPVVITTADPHGLVDGDVVEIVNTGLTKFEEQLFFVGNATDTTFELYVDEELSELFVYEALPDPTALSEIVAVGAGTDQETRYLKTFQGDFVRGAVVLGSEQNDFEFPIWPFPFVDQNFGGQMILPGVYDRGYEFPDVAFRLFFNTPLGAQAIGNISGDKPRNDLIMRLRFARGVATADLSGAQALVPGDLSRRDFEVELCLVDSLQGALKSLQSSNTAKSDAGASGEAGFEIEADLDGDGQSNLFEFAFDATAELGSSESPLADASTQVNAEVDVTIDGATGLCELSVMKRPGVRETIEYYFEQILPDGTAVEIEPDVEGSVWKTVKCDDNLSYKVVSTEPVSGSSFFRACARVNPFENEVIK
ncbi:hypothetical protein [Roseibacillus ishigakijimensis]|nr:hypothetical protein [Roseibacillus ishigakijimensis]